MGTNEFYYSEGIPITREEAHSLEDTSKLVVADKELTEEECKEALVGDEE